MKRLLMLAVAAFASTLVHANDDLVLQGIERPYRLVPGTQSLWCRMPSNDYNEYIWAGTGWMKFIGVVTTRNTVIRWANENAGLMQRATLAADEFVLTDNDGDMIKASWSALQAGSTAVTRIVGGQTIPGWNCGFGPSSQVVNWTYSR